MTAQETAATVDALVTPVQIARLAGVGRAAVSNWRKRHSDFPQPVGGMAASPQFALEHVVAWLRANDKLAGGLDPDEQLWQKITADAGAPHERRQLLARILAYLSTGAPSTLPEHLKTQVDELADAGRAELADRLTDRAQEAERAGIGFQATSRLGAMITSLLPDAGPARVLDPACEFGDLLRTLAPHLRGTPQLMAMDTDPALVDITVARLRLIGFDSVTGERDDGTAPDQSADLVISSAASGQRTLDPGVAAFDARWEFGMPPRSEPELAWLQHCFASVREEGALAMVMPSQVSTRSTGRRIRAELVRSGVLHSIVTLPSGLTELHHTVSLQLWILHRRASLQLDRATVRIIDATRLDADSLATAIAERWANIAGHPQVARDIAPIELIGDEMDLTPARLLEPPVPEVVEPFTKTRAEYLTVLDALRAHLPDLARGPQPAPSVPSGAPYTISELIKLGAVELLPAGTVLQPEDIEILQTTTSPARMTPEERAGSRSVGAIIRCERSQVDPYFLHGHLCSAANRHIIATGTHGNRVEIRRARIPRLPLDQQRTLGASLRSLIAFSVLCERAQGLGQELTGLAVDGLTSGQLHAAAGQAHYNESEPTTNSAKENDRDA
jgi:hypothetical protein